MHPYHPPHPCSLATFHISTNEQWGIRHLPLYSATAAANNNNNNNDNDNNNNIIIIIIIIIIIMNCKFLHSAWQITPLSYVVLTLWLCFPQSPEATGVLFVNDMTPDEEGKVCGRILSQQKSQEKPHAPHCHYQAPTSHMPFHKDESTPLAHRC